MVRVRVVLVEPEGAMNIGFTARLCMNFGVEELYIVNPKADLSEAARYSAHASELLSKATIVGSIDEALAGVDLVVATSAKGYSEGDYIRQAVPVREFAKRMLAGTDSVAILFGRESTGLTRGELEKADYIVTIPASPVYPVLNLSHAVAIVLYELWMRFRVGESPNVPPPAPRSRIDEILRVLNSVLEELRLHREKAIRIMHVFKSVISRGRISEYEARLLIYLLRKIERGLRRE